MCHCLPASLTINSQHRLLCPPRNSWLTVSPWWFPSAIFDFTRPLCCSKALLVLFPFTLKVNSPLLGFQRSSSEILLTLFEHFSLTTVNVHEHALPVVASGAPCMWFLCPPIQFESIIHKSIIFMATPNLNAFSYLQTPKNT